jgi:hypothetical protein
VKRSIRSAAARISGTRSRHSLCGTDRLGEDALAQLWPKAARCDQVHLAAEDRLEPLLNIEEVKAADRPAELDEDVGVAPWPCLVAAT